MNPWLQTTVHYLLSWYGSPETSTNCDVEAKMALLSHIRTLCNRSSTLMCGFAIALIILASSWKNLEVAVSDRTPSETAATQSESPAIVSSFLHTGFAIPLSPPQLANRTEVRTFGGEKATQLPTLKGIPISHFQNEDPSFWVSNVSRVEPQTLRVIRI